MIREPVVAGQFYPATAAGCETKIAACLPPQLPSDLPPQIVAGIVPHAGWDFSGPTAGRVFAAIHARREAHTFVIFSAMHHWGTSHSAVYGHGAWDTPLGQVAVDESLAQAVLDQGRGVLVDDPQAHAGEHSAEVQVPFIKHLFPHARILPIIVPPNEQAVATGRIVAEVIAARGDKVALLGTTDLTHYGPRFYGFAPAGSGEQALEWVRANDERIINMTLAMKAEQVVSEAATHHNACGSGALAATIAAARVLGASEGRLLEYTTSYHVMPHGMARDFVGYAAMVLG